MQLLFPKSSTTDKVQTFPPKTNMCSLQSTFKLPTISQNDRVKFNIEVSDPTASIEATIFPEIAEQFYGITGANIDTTEPNVTTLLLFTLNIA